MLMLANGWMTRFIKYDLEEGFDIYAPLMLLVIMVHLIMGALTVVDKDAHHKYHDYHGLLGYVIILAKFILVGIFFWFYLSTKKVIDSHAKPFFSQVLVIGLIYLLSDPLVILSAFLLDEVNR